jgi:hypothetical protein
MKKKIRKLVLSHETLGILESPQLRDAFGAWGTMETECCASWQPCSVVNCHTDTTPVRSA